MRKVKKNDLLKNCKTMVAFLMGIIISASTAYVTTTKALTEKGYAIESRNVEYQDNASLGVTNVQAAIDGTCTKFSEQLTELRESMYPIGSIYISTVDDTIEKVQEKIGGTWEKYAEGTVLVSANDQYKANTTGGNSTVLLNKNNIPSLSVTGTTNSTGNGYSIGYTTEVKTSGGGNSTFYRLVSGAGSMTISNHAVGYGGSYTDYNDANYPMASHNHNYNDKYVTSISGIEAHTHTFTGNYTNNSQTSINIQNPYTAVYMYKRTA